MIIPADGVRAIDWLLSNPGEVDTTSSGGMTPSEADGYLDELRAIRTCLRNGAALSAGQEADVAGVAELWRDEMAQH